MIHVLVKTIKKLGSYYAVISRSIFSNSLVALAVLESVDLIDPIWVKDLVDAMVTVCQPWL